MIKKKLNCIKFSAIAALYLLVPSCSKPISGGSDATNNNLNEKQRDVLAAASTLSGRLLYIQQQIGHCNITDDLKLEEMFAKDYKCKGINTPGAASYVLATKMGAGGTYSGGLSCCDNVLASYIKTDNLGTGKFYLTGLFGSLGTGNNRAVDEVINKNIVSPIELKSGATYKDNMDALNKIAATLFFAQWHNVNVYNKITKMEPKAFDEVIEILKKMDNKFKAPKFCPAADAATAELVVEKDKTELDITQYIIETIKILEKEKKAIELSYNLEDTMNGKKELDKEFDDVIKNRKGNNMPSNDPGF